MFIEKTIGNRVGAKEEIGGLDIPEMGILVYMTEDPIVVQNAGQDHLSSHGPGVPRKGTIASSASAEHVPLRNS
jgi:ammonium transporter, Amt family